MKTEAAVIAKGDLKTYPAKKTKIDIAHELIKSHPYMKSDQNLQSPVYWRVKKKNDI
jgi:hypothetical protein